MREQKRIANQLFRIIVFFQVLLVANTSRCQEADVEKVEFYLNQFAYFEYLDWDSAKMYLDSADIEANESTDPMVLGKLDLYHGWYFQDIAEFDSSRAFFFSALDYYTQANSYNKIADSYGNIGNAFLDIGDLKSALEYQLKSLSTNEQIILLAKDEQVIEAAIRGRAYSWSNLSNIYTTLGQYKKSLEFEIQGMYYEMENGDSIGLGISYINIGLSYKHLGQTDSSFYYITLAHDIFERHSFANGYISSNISLYEHSAEKGEPQLNYLLDAYETAREFDDKYSEVQVLGYLISGDFNFPKDSLQRMVNRGNKLMQENDLYTPLYDFYQHQAINSARWGEYKTAYESLTTYVKLFTERKVKNEGVDFENATLRHDYQLKTLQDSVAFEQTLNNNKLENEKKVSRHKNILMISIFGGIIMAIFLVFLYRALKVKKKTNNQLNENNLLIEAQKSLVEEKNKEITDSITYAKRLQNAILPPIELIKKDFNDSFVFYEPKDVISGDFYWFERKENLTFVAAADCTGHGVPGAIVSVVCSNALNRSVNEFNLTLSNEVLDKTRELVIDTFAKSGENVKDGMDICLCIFDRKNSNVQYSGANNPLWIIRRNEFVTEEQKEAKSTLIADEYSLIEIKPSKQPVGLYEAMKEFDAQTITFFQGDQFFLFTDGYADQFGGEKGKKLKYKRLKQLLLDNSQNDGDFQRMQLEKFLNVWTRDLEQVDDICIIGVKV